MLHIYLEHTKGHNKFYDMEQVSKTQFRATWGKIATTGQSKLYNMSDWNKIKNSKISKGYHIVHKNDTTTTVKKDQTDKLRLLLSKLLTSNRNADYDRNLFIVETLINKLESTEYTLSKDEMLSLNDIWESMNK